MSLASHFEKPWIRTALRSLAWGAGCGIGIAIVLAAAIYISDRPKQWDTKALQAKNVQLFYMQPIDAVGTGNGIGFFLKFDLENRTGTDISLPEDVTIMETNKKTGALSTSDMKHRSASFLPAHHTTSITLDTGTFCKFGDPNALSEKDATDCFNTRLKNVGAVVIFDEPSKYEIAVPVPPLSLGSPFS